MKTDNKESTERTDQFLFFELQVTFTSLSTSDERIDAPLDTERYVKVN